MLERDCMSVATLIPAFKPHFVLQLLRGLAQQTVRPDRVIISDDSPGGVFRLALKAPRLQPLIDALQPEVIQGPRKGGVENRRHLLRHWNKSTTHVHFLFDDDIIYPTFYERHLSVHASGRTRCTVSRRWIANQDGDPALQTPVPPGLEKYLGRLVFLPSMFLFRTVFSPLGAGAVPANWLGELSHAVFSSECAESLMVGQLAGIPYRGLSDLGAFLACSLDSPLGYLNENLGVFRLSPIQNSSQRDSLIFRQGILAWLALAIAARRLDRLDDAQIQVCFRVVANVFLSAHGNRPDSRTMVLAIKGLIEESPGAQDRFLAEWASYG